MATIQKTPDGKWRAQVRKKGFPAQSKTFDRKGDASRWAAQIEETIAAGTFSNRTLAEQLTVKEAVNRYLAEVSSKKAKITESIEHRKARQIIKELGEYTLATMTVDVVAKYRDTRLQTVKPNTVRLELAMLSHLMTVAIQEWRIGITVNPVQQIAKPRLPRGRIRRLLPAEEKRLFNAIDEFQNPMMRWVVRLALETGMRKNEILSLKKRNVKLSRNIIIVEDHLERGKAKSPREVPLTEVAETVINEAVNFSAHFIDTDLVFPGEYGKDGNRHPYEISSNWARVKKKAKLVGFCFHDLRHEAISRMVEMGLSDQQVSAISGHRTMQMLKRYTHLRGDDMVELIRSKKRVVLSVKTGTGSE